MRKKLSILLCLALTLALVGCGNSRSASGKTGNQPAGVGDVLEQGMAEADSQDSEVSESGGAAKDREAASSGSENNDAQEMEIRTGESADDVDVDLTVLSGTMVYSEVYNMMTTPEEYIGKTVKVKGPFSVFHDEATDNYYFACIIRDATACCAQGLEFELAGEHTYPDDYPEIDEEICVVGVFDTYTEGEYTYCTLRNAKRL